MAGLLLLMMVYAFGFSSAQNTWPNLNYPLNYGPPFAPANDNAFMNYLFLNQLKDPTSAGSQDPKINPYDDDADSFNTFALWAIEQGLMTPGAYQRWTQYSDPGATYKGYRGYAAPGQSSAGTGLNMFGPNMNWFWYMQMMTSMNQVEGTALDNSMLQNYLMMNNYYSGVNPYMSGLANGAVYPWLNGVDWGLGGNDESTAMNKRKRRSTGDGGSGRKRRSADKKRKRRAAKRKRRSAGKRR